MSEDGAISASTRAMELARRGLMFVLSSPSGAGKSTIARALLQADRALTMSVSVTTRTPRPGEVDGRDYHFITDDSYQELVASGELLEHAVVFGHGYGSPRGPVEEQLRNGRDVLFDVDWQGTKQLLEVARRDVACVFILPPSRSELERRLYRRAQDPEEVVRRRMAKAADEMSHWSDYDYIVVNHDLPRAVEAVRAILAAERLRRHRQVGLDGFVAAISHA